MLKLIRCRNHNKLFKVFLQSRVGFFRFLRNSRFHNRRSPPVQGFPAVNGDGLRCAQTAGGISINQRETEGIPIILFGFSAGFSLLEIMIALSILATSVMSLMAAQGGSFRASERAERITGATFLARAKMTEMEMEFEKDLAKNKFPDDNVEKEGTFDEPYEDYRWKYTIKKVEIPVVNAEGGEEASSGEEEGEEAAGTNTLVASYLKNVMEQISKSVRQVQLTIFWGDPELPQDDQPKMMVTTHWVKLK